MNFDLKFFSKKLKKLCDQRLVKVEELHNNTGIEIERLKGFFESKIYPTGDEILILSDFFNCDYRFFISNEKLSPFEQTEYLFRKHGKEFNQEDRKAIQEVLYLAECEDFLIEEMKINGNRKDFKYEPTNDFYKQHGIDAAEKLREFLGYKYTEIPRNVFDDFRKLGFHIYRRKLNNSKISGICIKHPKAGICILVNYNEDVYRQRFSVVHEVAHAIFDLDKSSGVYVSFEWNNKDLREIRANYFASSYLLPSKYLIELSKKHEWNEKNIIECANKLNVNVEVLVYALDRVKVINENQKKKFIKFKIPRNLKKDPELPDSLSRKERYRKQILLEKGISSSYVKLCFNAYRNNYISLYRMMEMLLINEDELYEIMNLYQERV